MPREAYQQQLAQLRVDVAYFANVVCDRYKDALEIYRSGTQASAETFIEGDHTINEQYLALEQECIDLFALQQPVASDLRFIASTFKILTDLERIADLATNIAAYGVADHRITLLTNDTVYDIGTRAHQMLADAIEAYENGQADRTREIANRDHQLDRVCMEAGETVAGVLLQTDVATVSEADQQQIFNDISRSLLAIRDIERVGDHTVNICARILYAVENNDGLLY